MEMKHPPHMRRFDAPSLHASLESFHMRTVLRISAWCVESMHVRKVRQKICVCRVRQKDACEEGASKKMHVRKVGQKIGCVKKMHVRERRQYACEEGAWNEAIFSHASIRCTFLACFESVRVKECVESMYVKKMFEIDACEEGAGN